MTEHTTQSVGNFFEKKVKFVAIFWQSNGIFRRVSSQWQLTVLCHVTVPGVLQPPRGRHVLQQAGCARAAGCPGLHVTCRTRHWRQRRHRAVRHGQTTQLEGKTLQKRRPGQIYRFTARPGEYQIVWIIDYLKKGLGTAMLGVWNLGPSMKMGVYFKHSLWQNY